MLMRNLREDEVRRILTEIAQGCQPDLVAKNEGATIPLCQFHGYGSTEGVSADSQWIATTRDFATLIKNAHKYKNTYVALINKAVASSSGARSFDCSSIEKCFDAYNIETLSVNKLETSKAGFKKKCASYASSSYEVTFEKRIPGTAVVYVPLDQLLKMMEVALWNVHKMSRKQFLDEEMFYSRRTFISVEEEDEFLASKVGMTGKVLEYLFDFYFGSFDK